MSLLDNYPVKVNIGASSTYLPDFTNIDWSEKVQQAPSNIRMDLNKEFIPLAHDSVDLVFTHHCLEHLDRYLHAMGEIWRILKHGGILLMGVPYVTCTEFNLVNPYHKHHFNEFSLDFFDPTLMKGSASEDNPILMFKIYHKFEWMDEWKYDDPHIIEVERSRDYARRHYFNVVKAIEFGARIVKDQADDFLWIIDDKEKFLLKSLFKECKTSRVSF